MMTKKERIVRILFALIGDMVLSFGASLMVKANLGADAFTVGNLGMSGAIGVSLGVFQMLVGLFIGVVVFFLNKKLLGIGSIINICCTGFFIEFFLYILKDFSIDGIVLRFFFMALGLVIETLGLSLYSQAGIGAGSYDVVPVILTERTKIKFFVARMSLDTSFLLIGWILGGPIGIASLFAAFGIGPMLGIFNPKISQKLLRQLIGETHE